jgi:cytochrome c-type biogenesis protein CcmE
MDASMEYETGSTSRTKFVVGGVLILAAVIYLIISATNATAEYFYTIDEMANLGDSIVGKSIRVSGAIDGETIRYDPETLTLEFTVAHVPGDLDEIDSEGGLAKVLHEAVIDGSRNRLNVVYNGVKPDLMRNEAQAIMTGTMGEDGVFHADELLLKCPTRYEEYTPEQVEG